MVINAIFEKCDVFREKKDTMLKCIKIYFPLIMLTGPQLPRYSLHSSSNDKGILFYFIILVLFRKVYVKSTGVLSIVGFPLALECLNSSTEHKVYNLMQCPLLNCPLVLY